VKLAALVALLALAVPASASAISILAPTSTSTSITLNGFDQTATFSTALTIGGPGSGGWNVTAWAARPTSGSNTLSQLTVDSQPSTSCSGGGCVKASSSLSWPVTLGTASGGAVKIFNAAKNTGTGTGDTVTPTFSIAVPANAYPGAYTTTITFVVATGP
jgi:hypothetical protein